MCASIYLTYIPAYVAGKTHANLVQLQSSIQEQLESGEAADPEYWAAVLERLQPQKAKAKLREVHRDLLQQHLDRTQHLRDTVNVAEEMGWDEEDKVKHRSWLELHLYKKGVKDGCQHLHPTQHLQDIVSPCHRRDGVG